MNLLSKDNWNEFVARNSSPSSFLQSWQWGQFQAALGHKVYRFDIQNQLLAQVVIKRLPFGRTYLEVPKGPIFDESRITNHELGGTPSFSPPNLGGEWRGGMQALIEKIKEIGRQEKSVLARINPPHPSVSSSPGDGEELKERSLAGLGFRKPEILLRQMEPARTILVDLSRSEEELLENMHEKSRYNIRLAQRRGVKVRVATQDKGAFEIFLKLLEETTKRDGIVSWPRERFMKFRDIFMTPSPDARLPDGQEGRVEEGSNTPQVEALFSSSLPRRGEGPKERSLAPHAELLVGEYQGEILAAAVIMLFGDSGTYLYAASSAKERTANAPSLVLWEAIKLSRQRGKKWYDLWGVAPPNEPDHPWAGITRFKTRYVTAGVTGKEVYGVGARDLVLNRAFYALFKLYKLFRG